MRRNTAEQNGSTRSNSQIGPNGVAMAKDPGNTSINASPASSQTQ